MKTQFFTNVFISAPWLRCTSAGDHVDDMANGVTDDKGEPLIGATVVATHTPSGTTYGTVTNENGKLQFIEARW
ncbi:MAG: carboxypeptidase-like regulatory domain-containing protein [Saprospiraceae bacterium]